jgi:hypothetical protein
MRISWWTATRFQPGVSGGSRCSEMPLTRCTRSDRTGHPMRSSMLRVLAGELALGSSIETATANYEAERRPATAGVVQANGRGGPEQILQVIKERAPDGFTNLDDITTPRELEAISHAYHRIAGFDSESLNNRPSLSVR